MSRWWKAILLAAVMMITLSGCVDYEEEITLARDGSGTVRIHYYMDESMIEMMEGETPFDFDKGSIEERFKDASVKLAEIEVYTKDEQRHVVLVIEFPDLETLQGGWPFSDRTIMLTRRNDGSIEYRMAIKMNAAEDAAGGEADAGIEASAAEESESEGDEYELPAEVDAEMTQAAAEMAQAALAGHFFKYMLNVPGEIIEVSDGGTIKGRQVTWELPLEELTGITEFVMTVRYKP